MSMIAELPEWYKISSLEGTPEATLEKRSAVIRELIKTKDLAWMLNCVRHFLNKPVVDEFTREFVKAFSADPMFPQKDNSLEIQVLSGAIIHECIKSDEREDTLTVALSLMTGIFGVTPKTLINTDIITEARSYITARSIDSREKDDEIEFDALPDDDTIDEADSIEKLGELSKTLRNYIEALTSSLRQGRDRMRVLEEESNIHWWLFRQFSDIGRCKVKDLGYNIAPIILGAELGVLTNIAPGPYPSDHFLSKILSDHSDVERPIALKDAINELTLDLKTALVSSILSETFGNLSPLNLAIAKAIETEDKTSWIVLFEKSTKVKASYKPSRIELAMQAYLEKILLLSIG